MRASFILASCDLHPERLGAHVLSFLLTLVAVTGTAVGGAGEAAADPATASCTIAAPVYRHVPVFGDRLGDISEWPITHCVPGEDAVRVLSDLPSRDNTGGRWSRVVLDHPIYGRRCGWIPTEYVERTDLPPGARVPAREPG